MDIANKQYLLVVEKNYIDILIKDLDGVIKKRESKITLPFT